MWADGKFPAHLVEEIYDLQDALVCAQFLMSFIRNADVVKVANLAQIANVIAPVLTKDDKLLRQTIFEALAMFVGRRAGNSLRLGYSGPVVPSPEFDSVAMLDGAAILSEGNELYVFAVNRSTEVNVELTVELSGSHLEPVSCELLHHSDPTTQNTWDNPDSVRRSQIEMSSGLSPVIELPPHCLVAMTLKVS